MSLAFLKQCVPKKYIQEIDRFYTLDSALKSLNQWCSDSKIHTSKIETELCAIAQSNSLEPDRKIMSDQIMKLQHVLEIDSDFYMSLTTVWTHIVKYFEATSYSTIFNNLNYVARQNSDLQGKKNYILLFLECLKQQLRYINERISCNHINQIAAPQKRPKLNVPRVGSYNTGA